MLEKISKNLKRKFQEEYDDYKENFVDMKYIKGTDQHSYAFAYVIFKSMKDLNSVYQAYDINQAEVMMVNWFGGCCCK